MEAPAGYDFIIRVLATSSALIQESQRFFRPLGITDAQFNVLNILGLQPEGMSQRQLSELLVVDRSNVTGLLDRLEKAGWVKRQDHPEDRRVYQVNLTRAGRRMWERILPRYMEAVKEVTAEFSLEEMKRTVEILEKLDKSARDWAQNRAKANSTQSKSKS